MNFPAIFLVLFYNLKFAFSYRDTVIEIVNNVIKNEQMPLQLIMVDSCWGLDASKSIMNKFLTPLQLVDIDELNVLFTDKQLNLFLFVLDLNCNSSKNQLSKLKHDFYFTHPKRWIIFANDTNDSSSKFIHTVNAYPDSNIIICDRCVNDSTNFELNQFYRLGIKSNETIYEKYGIWNGTTKELIDLRETPIISRRRRNLQGYTLTASVVITNNDTYKHLRDYKNMHIDAVAKSGFVITNHLMDAVNASKNFKFVSTWGYKDPKTQKYVDGMISDMLNKRAEIGGSPLFIMAERVEDVEYASMTTPTMAHFIFRAPPLSSVSNIYLLPFQGIVWICIGAILLLCIVSIFIISRFENHYVETQSDDSFDESRFSDVVLLGVGAVCQMGSSFGPTTFAGRTVFIYLFVTFLFMYTSYTANIVALLQSSTKSIQTLSDLLHSSLELGVEDIVYNRHFFPTETEPIRKAIYQTKVAPNKKSPRFMNHTVGISKVRKGMFAFHGELGPAYKIIEETFYEHEKCNLHGIKFLQVNEPWLALQKGTYYKEILKINLFRLRESGLQQMEHSRLYTKKPICAAHGQNFSSVRLHDCMFAVIVLGYGFLISFLLLVLEKILIRSKKIKICLY